MPGSLVVSLCPHLLAHLLTLFCPACLPPAYSLTQPCQAFLIVCLAHLPSQSLSRLHHSVALFLLKPCQPCLCFVARPPSSVPVPALACLLPCPAPSGLLSHPALPCLWTHEYFQPSQSPVAIASPSQALLPACAMPCPALPRLPLSALLATYAQALPCSVGAATPPRLPTLHGTVGGGCMIL